VVAGVRRRDLRGNRADFLPRRAGHHTKRVMRDPITAARELLSLEAARPLDAAQLAQWQTLAAAVFPRDYAREQRTAIRLCGQAPMQVQIDERAFSVVDMSWGGLALSGDTSHLPQGETRRITAVRRSDDEAWQPLSVAVRVRSLRDGVAGLSITEPDPMRVNSFFSRAYYPLYLAQVGAIAAP
jgi:hypothetical protein